MCRIRVRVCAALIAGALGVGGWAHAEPGGVVMVTGAGNLPCSTWLKAREDKFDRQTELIVQWIAGFAVAHNVYLSGSKQLDVDLADIPYFVDAFCRDDPLSLLINAATKYVAKKGGTAPPQGPSGKK